MPFDAPANGKRGEAPLPLLLALTRLAESARMRLAGPLDEDRIDVRRPVGMELAETNPPRNEADIMAWESCDGALELVDRPAGEASSITHGENRRLGRIEENE
jgi:hypothetical protein